jgi:hypothetical protein
MGGVDEAPGLASTSWWSAQPGRTFRPQSLCDFYLFVLVGEREHGVDVNEYRIHHIG